MLDEHFDKPDRRPLVSTAAVRWICCTVVLLTLVGLVAVAAWHRPDDAVRAVAVLWLDFKVVLGAAAALAGFIALVFFLSITAP